MGNCIRTAGVLLDGALWNVYIQKLAILLYKTADQYYKRVLLYFYWVDMIEMFEQVLTLCLNHKPFNLCRVLEAQKKARL